MLTLRPYQTESIQALREGIKAGHRCQILCAATGSGKSVVATELLRCAGQKDKKCLFIVDRRVLVSQFSGHLQNYRIPHGIIMKGHGRTKDNIQVASAQTMEKMDSWPAFDLIIIDEIHACFRKSIKKLIEMNSESSVLGLTATPLTKGLGNVFSNVVNVITMRELVDQGFLVPFKVFVAHEIDTAGLETATTGEYKPDQLEERAKLIVGDVVRDYLKLSQEQNTGKTICFSSGVEHGVELAMEFANHGKNFVSISYRDDEDYKKEVLDEFAKPDSSLHGVISTDILTRGFDQTDIDHVILARPLKKSLALHIQMIGRGARSHTGKTHCIIQDHSGNYLLFKYRFDEIYNNGIHKLHDGMEKPPSIPSEKEKKESSCPSCGLIWSKGSTLCPNCGFVFVKKSNVVQLHGVMTELNGTVEKAAVEKYSSQYKEKFYQQLLGYARQHRYADGWAYHQYIKKFSIAPPWKKLPLEPGINVINYVKSRQIAYAKRK